MIAARAATNPSQFALPDDNVTDGNGVQGTITVGVSTDDGRGNITAYASTRTTRKYCSGIATSRPARCANPASNAGTVSFTCGGSGTAFPGTFTPNFVTNYSIGGTAGVGNGTFRPFVGATDQYNFGPVNHYLRPDTRYSLGAMGHYELAEFADVYTQLMFTDVRSIAQIAPGGAFFDTSTINCDNPFLSAQQLTTIGCTPAMTRPATTAAAVHWSSQRRRRRSPAGLPQLLVPRPVRLARRDRGRLGLRREHAVRPHHGGPAHAELFRH